MATSRRQQRVNHALQHEISKLLETELNDPRLEGLTVSGVEISPDLRRARVFIIAVADAAREREVRAGLESATPFLRRELGKRVQLRIVPELDFRFDRSLDHGARIEQLLREH
jgi:ribosome-binding factor A